MSPIALRSKVIKIIRLGDRTQAEVLLYTDEGERVTTVLIDITDHIDWSDEDA